MMVKDMYKASMIEFVFKVIKNLVPPIFQNYYIFNARRVTRQNKELLISRVKTEQAKKKQQFMKARYCGIIFSNKTIMISKHQKHYKKATKTTSSVVTYLL